MHAVLPLAFAYLGTGSKYNEEGVRKNTTRKRLGEGRTSCEGRQSRA